MFDIWNRRYTGSKYKLSSWISKLIEENCEGNFFCDIFAGTGIISYTMLNKMKKIYINDFIYSVVKILHINPKSSHFMRAFWVISFYYLSTNNIIRAFLAMDKTVLNVKIVAVLNDYLSKIRTPLDSRYGDELYRGRYRYLPEIFAERKCSLPYGYDSVRYHNALQRFTAT